MSFKYSQGFFAMNVENIFSLNFGSIRLEYMKLEITLSLQRVLCKMYLYY